MSDLSSQDSEAVNALDDYLTPPQLTLTTVSGLIYPEDKGQFVQEADDKRPSPNGLRLCFNENNPDIIKRFQITYDEPIRVAMVVSNFTNEVDEDFLARKVKKNRTSKRAQSGTGIALGSQISFTLIMSNVKCKACDAYAWYGTTAKLPKYCKKHKKDKHKGVYSMSNTIKVFRNGNLNITDGKVIDKFATQPVLAPEMYNFVEYLRNYISLKLELKVQCVNFKIEMKNYKTFATKKYDMNRFNIPLFRMLLEKVLKEGSFKELSEVKLTDKQILSVGITLRKIEGAIKKHSTTILIYNGAGLKVNYKGKNDSLDVKVIHEWLHTIIKSNKLIYFERCTKFCKYAYCNKCKNEHWCSVCKFCYTCNETLGI